MSTDDLDDRIRALVGRAAKDAPAAPPLPTAAAPVVVPFRPRPRGWLWAAGAATAAAAIVATVVLVTDDDEPGRIAPATTDAVPTPTTVSPPLTTAPPDTTTPPETTAPTTTLDPAWGRGWAVLAVGEDGMRVQSDLAEDVVWATEPMARAVTAPDGSLIVQRHAGVGESTGWTMGDTLPLRIAAPGEEPTDLFGPGADPVPGWYKIHDAATVNGSPLLLLERQHDMVGGLGTEPGELLTLDLATGQMVVVVDDFGGWEEGSSRLHLAETGLVVGEYYSLVTSSFFAVNVLDEVSAPNAADFGLESSYDECIDCPRRFTVSRDGSTVAWLDGTELVVQTGPEADRARFDLGQLAADVADLHIGDGYVLLDYAVSWVENPPSPVVLLYTIGEQVTIAGRSASLAG